MVIVLSSAISTTAVVVRPEVVAVMTVVRGEIVAAQGKVMVKPGYGTYRPRQC